MRFTDEVYVAGSFHKLVIELGNRTFTLAGITHQIPDEYDTIISGRVGVTLTGRRFAVFAPAESHRAIAFIAENNQFVLLPAGAGRGVSAMRGSEVHCQGTNEDGQNTTISVFDLDQLQRDENGEPVPNRSYRAHYGSMGILQVTGPETIVSTADAGMQTVNGVNFWYLFRDPSGWACGQVEAFPPGGSPQNGTIGLIAPDGTIHIAALTATWNGYTNMPAYLAVSPDARAHVSIQDSHPQNSAPASEDIVWLPLNPPIDPPIDPPVDPPVPGYNPKADLQRIQADLARVIAKLP